MLEKIWAYLRLIRIANVVIAAASFVLFQCFVLAPLLQSASFAPTLNGWMIVCLALAIACITAAGNIINDYYDFDQDKKWRSDQIVLGKYISLDMAVYLLGALNLIGIGLALFVAYKVGNIKIANVFFLSALLLWLYSSTLKKIPLLGNLVIAFLCALVFLIPVLFERSFFVDTFAEPLAFARESVLMRMKGYMLFAFLITLIREVVKDMEDYEADKSFGINTLPVAAGITVAKIFAVLLTLLMMAFIGYLQYIYWINGAKNHFWFAVLMLQFPLLVNLLPLIPAKDEKSFAVQSVMMKLVIVFGLCSMPAFHFFSRLI
jgi:4-hydroxybenzoate polyprenyltransferase